MAQTVGVCLDGNVAMDRKMVLISIFVSAASQFNSSPLGNVRFAGQSRISYHKKVPVQVRIAPHPHLTGGTLKRSLGVGISDGVPASPGRS